MQLQDDNLQIFPALWAKSEVILYKSLYFQCSNAFNIFYYIHSFVYVTKMANSKIRSSLEKVEEKLGFTARKSNLFRIS